MLVWSLSSVVYFFLFLFFHFLFLFCPRKELVKDFLIIQHQPNSRFDMKITVCRWIFHFCFKPNKLCTRYPYCTRYICYLLLMKISLNFPSIKVSELQTLIQLQVLNHGNFLNIKFFSKKIANIYRCFPDFFYHSRVWRWLRKTSSSQLDLTSKDLRRNEHADEHLKDM